MTEQAKNHPHRTGAMLAFWMFRDGWRDRPDLGGWRKVGPAYEMVIPYAALHAAASARHPERFADFVRGWQISLAEQLDVTCFEWDQGVTDEPSVEGLVRGGYSFLDSERELRS